MYFAHTFAHRETLSRAHSWLTQLGFHPRQATPGSSTPRLVLVDDPQRLAAAKMLINAAENADPDGFQPFWNDIPHSLGMPEERHEGISIRRDEPHSSPIGWHPID